MSQKSQILKPIDEMAQRETEEHPVFELLRVANGRPVLRGTGTTFEGLTLPNFFGRHHQEMPSLAILSFDLARAVFGDAGIYSNDFYGDDFTASMGRGLFSMDPPEHTQLRALAQMGFVPRIVMAWDEEIIRPSIVHAVATVSDLGRADIAQDVALKFPYEIICRILGLPDSDIDFVSDRITKMTRSTYDAQTARSASIEMKTYVSDYVDQRRKTPSDDFISALLQAEVDGERLTDEALLALIFLLFPAGMETTFRGASNLCHLLLSNPDQFELVRSDRSLISAAIEEMLRVEGPSSMFPRLAKREAELNGMTVPAGTMLFVMAAAANRDPSRWERPHEFDVRRPPKAHLGFGYGPHACIGLHLARKELRIFLEQVLDKMPGLRWDPALDSIPPIEGWTLRSALSVPAVWDVA